MSANREIVERLEKAKGADRALDAWVALATGGDQKVCPGGVHGSIRGVKFSFTGKTLGAVIDEYPLLVGDAAISFGVPAYTASLDAAIALVERMGFPSGCGWNYTMASAYGSFSIIPNDPQSYGIHDKRCGHAHGAATMPIALLLALFRALDKDSR